ncbi:MAG TPA: glycerol-3-phosphate 1-O-acyltransferase PlsY [Candidatus Acidoferrales bacterium]|nr:glycerol-3-phosphate 1-O-acyltransferase PlsY [Candidatus Acidoferrales bacterium]
MNILWLIPLIAYLLGSIPFGFLLVKARRGGDIRGAGSGNIGAANVARNAGFALGALTLVLDAGKGYLAVWLAARWSGSHAPWIAAAAVLAVAGHVFPIWLGFRGGKGVATALGAFLAISPGAIGAAVALWILIVIFWGYSSLGSIVAVAALPVLLYLLYAPRHAPPISLMAAAILVSLLVLAKHQSNMRRLLAGEEQPLRSRKK